MDRDGTLAPDIPYLDDPEKLRLFPEAAGAIADLKKAGFLVVLITNQSGVGRGMFSEDVLGRIHARLRKMLNERGTDLDGLYYCPHTPEEGCSCRKPATGMIDRATEEMSLSRAGSYVVGDDIVDVELARNAGLKSVLVLTGHGVASRLKLDPDAVVENLTEAVNWILRDSGQNE